MILKNTVIAGRPSASSDGIKLDSLKGEIFKCLLAKCSFGPKSNKENLAWWREVKFTQKLRNMEMWSLCLKAYSPPNVCSKAVVATMNSNVITNKDIQEQNVLQINKLLRVMQITTFHLNLSNFCVCHLISSLLCIWRNLICRFFLNSFEQMFCQTIFHLLRFMPPSCSHALFRATELSTTR